MPRAGAKEMITLGIIQHPDPILRVPTTPYDLPAESDIARQDFEQLRKVASAVFALHPTEKGLGVAAPQIGIDRRIAIVRPWGVEELCLLNAQIIEQSDATDLRYEGCLSLFDLRGKVSRPLRVIVRAQHFDGRYWEHTFDNATARLICHELDHLDGRLYSERMEEMGEALINVDEYRALPLLDTDWIYE